jgi:hypothetical protein
MTEVGAPWEATGELAGEERDGEGKGGRGRGGIARVLLSSIHWIKN